VVDCANSFNRTRRVSRIPRQNVYTNSIGKVIDDDKTQVTGAEKTVEGLTGKTGAMLKVTYQEKGADQIATRIEVSEAKK
jgi:hypothetical protein